MRSRASDSSKDALACLLVLGLFPANAANLFVSGSGSGSLGGAPAGSLVTGGFPQPTIQVDRYDDLEAATNGSVSNEIDTAADRTLDLIFSQGVNLSFNDPQGTNGSLGNGLVITLIDAVAAGGQFTVTFQAPQGWGPGSPTGNSITYDLGLTNAVTGDGQVSSFQSRSSFGFVAPDATPNDSTIVSIKTLNGAVIDAAGIPNNNSNGFGSGPNGGEFDPATRVNNADGSTTLRPDGNNTFGGALRDSSGVTNNALVTEASFTFNADPNGSGFAPGTQFRISIDGSPVLNPVPEPSAIILSLLGTMLLIGRRSRKGP